jgi:pimeloyl-ACP methyl ester carboxylesterase
MFHRWLFLLAVAAVPAGLFAGEPPRPAEPECQELTFPVKWAYCIYPGEDDGSRVVYFMHGLGHSEKTWGEKKDGVGALLRDQWALDGKKRPTVISVSFGPFWLIAPRNGSKYGGLLEAFPVLVIPTVEKKLAKVPDERVLLGESMGGFNATQLAFKASKYWVRSAMLCPPITELGPNASPEAIKKFVEETGAKPDLVENAVKLSKTFFPTDEAWADAAPLNLVAKADGRSVPPLQVTCGNRDEYGFYPGSRKFALTGLGRGLKLDWRSLLAGHCAMDAKATAAFLLAR